jgi:hypothetical protein
MPVLSRAEIKAYFETNDEPTQSEFVDFIDSVFWTSDNLPASQVLGTSNLTFSDATKGVVLTKPGGGTVLITMGDDDQPVFTPLT